MEDPILNFAAFFRAKLSEIPELGAVVSNRIYNSKAPQKAVLPFAIFTIIPLEDNFGQGRSSIQTRLLCDFKIETRLPVSPAVGVAVAETVEKFRTARTAENHENFRISVWGLRPISRLSSGAVSSEEIYSVGKTFQATMSRIPAIPNGFIPFLNSANVPTNFALAEGGTVGFIDYADVADNIFLNLSKIPFIDRADEQQLISLI